MGPVGRPPLFSRRLESRSERQPPGSTSAIVVTTKSSKNRRNRHSLVLSGIRSGLDPKWFWAAEESEEEDGIVAIDWLPCLCSEENWLKNVEGKQAFVIFGSAGQVWLLTGETSVFGHGHICCESSCNWIWLKKVSTGKVRLLLCSSSFNDRFVTRLSRSALQISTLFSPSIGHQPPIKRQKRVFQRKLTLRKDHQCASVCCQCFGGRRRLGL